MDCGIYRLINLITGDYYIGRSSVLQKRKTKHLSEFKYNRNHNKPLQENYNIYGKENIIFEIVLYCEIIDLKYYEQLLVNKLNPKYNVYVNDVDTPKGIKLSEEARKKIGYVTTGSCNPMFGRTGMSSPMYGKPRSEETKQKISLALKNRKSIF